MVCRCQARSGRMRYCLLLSMGLVLSGCGSAPQPATRLEVATPITLTPKQVSSVRAGVAKSLKYDVEAPRVGKLIAGRTSNGVIVCGYVNGKNSAGEDIGERPFHGLFLGFDNASGFIVTGTGGAESETATTLDMCRRSGLELTPSS
jgi:hypothetical protein